MPIWNRNALFIKALYEKEHSTYVAKYLGHFANIGTYTNENWVWKEPKFKHRYINVFMQDNEFIINLSWNKKQAVIDFMECADQREAEKFMELFEGHYSVYGKTIRKYEGNPCAFNIVEYPDEIKITLDKKDWGRSIRGY